MKWLAQGHITNQRDILETTDRFSSTLGDAFSVVGEARKLEPWLSVFVALWILFQKHSVHITGLSACLGVGGHGKLARVSSSKPQFSRLLLQFLIYLGKDICEVCVSKEESSVCGFWSLRLCVCKFKHPQRLKGSCRWNYSLLGATP